MTSTERMVDPVAARPSRGAAAGSLRASSTSRSIRRPGPSCPRTPGIDRTAAAAAARSPARDEAHPVEAADEGHQLPSRPLGDDPALVDDADPIAQALGLLHVVGRVQDAHARPS